MSRPEEGRGNQKEQESSVLGAFNRMEYLFASLEFKESRSESSNMEKRGSFVDGTIFRVKKLSLPDNGIHGPEIVSYDVRVYNGEKSALGFVLNQHGLRDLLIPGVDAVVGDSRFTLFKKSLEINWDDFRLPEESRQKFRASSVQFVNCFDNNLSAKAPDKMMSFPVTLSPYAGVPRAQK